MLSTLIIERVSRQIIFKKQYIRSIRASPIAQLVKNLPASAEDARDVGLIPGWENALEKEMATHSSILAWRIPCTEEPGGLQFMGCKELDKTERVCTHTDP